MDVEGRFFPRCGGLVYREATGNPCAIFALGGVQNGMGVHGGGWPSSIPKRE